MVALKRVYDPPGNGDGFRILVDRLWPRGISKTEAHIDLWMKDIAPSTALRKWFGHDPKKWRSFQNKYRTELIENEASVARLRAILHSKKTVTLLYGARDTQHNQAVVLCAYLNNA